jgi:hypothetical protein
LNAILDEFAEAHTVRRVRKATRRQLLEILHSTRALDTALAAFIDHHGCRDGKGRVPHSLGQYLFALRDHSVVGLGRITGPERLQFNSAIVVPRNRYAHEAGTFPSGEAEVNSLLAEMGACLTVVTRL